MNYKNREIIDIAQSFGYSTAKEFANFLKKYNPSIETDESGEKFIYLTLV